MEMELRKKRSALAALTLSAIVTLPLAARAEETGDENKWLKERLKQLEAKVAEQDRELKEIRARVRNVTARPSGSKRPVHHIVVQGGGPDKAPASPPPIPILVSLKNGFSVETPDRDFNFRVGGRVFVDGGISSQPEAGFASHVNIPQARLEVKGTAFRYWNYKLEYDFAGSAPLTSLTGTSTTPAGGIRDAYLALTYFDPVTFQVGNFYEPHGLERTNSKKYIEFVERSMMSEALAGNRHIGFAAFTHGASWTAKGGVFSTSLEDKALAPLPGGAQYWDLAGRVTYAPIRSEDSLAHLGGSVRYQRPNSATAASDDRVLAIGSNVRTENNVLNENLLGTPDLSCGPKVQSLAGTVFVTVQGNLVQRSCAKNVLTFGAELAAVYGPFSVQAEYMGSHYNRDAATILALGAPGGPSLDFSGYYVYGAWYLTGETRAASYRDDFHRPGTFGQIKINSPLSAGGIGAWELAARFSELDLDNGGIIPVTNLGVIGLKTLAALIALSNTGVIGGREENVTVGLNWYPDIGFRVMANWTRVVHLTAPFDRPFLNGAHPNIFLIRTQVDW